MKTPHGERRDRYIPAHKEALSRYANTPEKVRRGCPGDKLRRKAFEGGVR